LHAPLKLAKSFFRLALPLMDQAQIEVDKGFSRPRPSDQLKARAGGFKLAVVVITHRLVEHSFEVFGAQAFGSAQRFVHRLVIAQGDSTLAEQKLSRKQRRFLVNQVRERRGSLTVLTVVGRLGRRRELLV